MGLVRNRRRFGVRPLAAALLGTTFLVGLAGPALADSHLETENAELRDRLETLEQELQILKNLVLQQNTKNLEQDELITEAAEPGTPEKMVTSGKGNVSLEVSGQANRMLLIANDGAESRTFHADNDMSSTRIRLKGKAKLDDEWSAGTTVEVQVESNSSAKVQIDSNDINTGKESFTERKLEVWLKGKNAGKFSLGQGSTASDGTVEEDLSGTGVISGSGSGGALGADIQFVDRDGNRTLKVDSVFDSMDGLGRADRLRYDSPTFSGFQFSLSHLGGDWSGAGEDDPDTPEDETEGGVDAGAWDVALRYGREFDGLEVAGAIGRWEADKHTSGYGGSLSFLLPSGTSVSGSFAKSETDGADHEPSFTYFKVGQELDLTSLGKTAVSIGYSNSDEQGKGGNATGTHYDLAAVQKIKGLGAELYAVYGVYDADIMETPTREVSVTGVGARIKF